MMKRLIVLVLLASTLLTGCNTARGFGEDIKHLGNSISRCQLIFLLFRKIIRFPSFLAMLSIINLL
ncbi:hypothetical protein EC51104_4925 [Escherichia coli]|nr:hypothetical protein EC51104_4925 [Escherichia coli]